MVKTINSQELKKKLDDKEKLVLIDCREQLEWDRGHIEGAILIPLSEFAELYGERLTDVSAQIIVQCRSGKRSMTACELLRDKGYHNLTNLEGGILGWQAEDYKVKMDS